QGQVELRASGHFERTIALPSEPLTIVLGKRLDLEAKLVSAEDGEPLGPPGAITLLGPGFSRWVEIESAGCIRCLDLPAGRYRLLPQLPGRASIVSEFELPEGGLGQPLVIRLPRGGRVTGMVTDDGGAPLAGV